MDRPRLTAAALLASLALAAPARGSSEYLAGVRPLFQEHCVRCHGPTQQKAGLRLDTAAAALAGGQSGPAVIPGQPEQSLLLQAIRGTAAGLDRMPYKKPALTGEEQERISTWIAAGAPHPEEEPVASGPGATGHWSFAAPESPRAPPAHSFPATAAVNPIDAFILRRLQENGLTPSPPADPVTLLRRVHLDLTGLPPSPAEVDAFLEDPRPDAYDRAVDRLLFSPHYGEHWGRHWLDAARYADSNGYSIDNPRTMWLYRDWVVRALNAGVSYEQFATEQLAGDLLPGATEDQLIATGFHRNTQINEEGGIDPEQFRIEAVMDRVATTGVVFLGITTACAQCHEHKFDPVSQEEYYRLFAFFNNADEVTLESGNPEERAQRDALRQERRGLEQELRALPKDDPGAPALRERIAALQQSEPSLPTALILQERSEPRDTRVFIKGDFTRPGDPVRPGTPAFLPTFPEVERPTRLDLARWLFREDQPLTSRVMVNRIWQRYFGAGLVETENDFGTQGTAPSHPTLLDWLAVEFRRSGWDFRRLHRLIVTSATYRQASSAHADLAAADPLNRLLGRQSRHRLEAEIVRDVALSASGVLSRRLGGPGVHPPQPSGVMDLGQARRTWTADEGEDRYRRGLYTFFWRATPHPALRVFDAPDALSACTRRVRSNTPLQALTLLNDPAFVDLARLLAARLCALPAADDPQRLAHGFRLCLARPPRPEEETVLAEFLESQRAGFAADPAAARAFSGRSGATDAEAAEAAAWTALARVILNLDETISRE